MTPSWGMFFGLFLFFNLIVQWSEAVSVMSVDFGSEWMKVAIVSPGVPMEIALNKESKRKTPAFISLRDGERTFGEDAQTLAVRFPAQGYGYLLDLLGKTIDNPIVQLYKQRFPWYNIVGDPVRNTVVFQHDSETQFTPEELIGMLLKKAKEFAEDSAGQPISDAVLVVPGYFSQTERLAMKHAAHFAGLKVLQLINDYTAVALNYGIFRPKDFNETAQYIMFYDMGASSTTATLVSYQLVKTKDRGVVETHPQASIIGVGYDRTLGGLDMQIRLQKFLGEKFNAVKKTKNNVFENPRAMAKLFKEAGRLKNVLSANVDHFAQIEGLLDEEDFKVKVTREEFEELCKDLFERVENPVKQALSNAGVSMDIINQVILVGGGTRVPKVQEALSKIFGIELSKNINADEAAVMGAVYKAADMSTGFKVKKFITRDVVLFPILVSYERETDSGEVKQMKRTLFGAMNSYPQKKMITFNKFTKDFSFDVYYGELDHLPKEEILALGPSSLFKISLTSVADVISKHAGPTVEPKGIKAHFFVDDSGIINLGNVDYSVEKTEGDEQSTLQKIGSSLGKLFGGSKAAETIEGEPADSSGEAEEKQEKEAGARPEAAANSTEETKTDAKTEGSANATEKADKKPKITIVKENIPHTQESLGVKPPTEELLAVSLKKIQALDDFDAKKRRKEKARNQLESFVFDVQTKLDVDLYLKSSTPEEKDSIRQACSEISAWLDEEGYDADAVTYEDKLTHVKSLTGPLFRRVREHEDRPEAVAALKSRLEVAKEFAGKVRNRTDEGIAAGEETIFTTVEIDVLDKLIAESAEWLEKLEKDQNGLKLYEAPVLTIRSIGEKLHAIDREVNYLVNKAKIWRPTKKPTNETKTEEKVQKSNETVKEAGDNVLEEPPKEETAEHPAEAELDRQKEETTGDSKEPSETETKESTDLVFKAWMCAVALVIVVHLFFRWG